MSQHTAHWWRGEGERGEGKGVRRRDKGGRGEGRKGEKGGEGRNGGKGEK